MAIKKARNKMMKESNGLQKEYMFPGNPPVTIEATSHKESLEKFEKLKDK